MTTYIAHQQAFKRAAQYLSKLPNAGSLSDCQTALAKATGHRDLHQAQALQARHSHAQTAVSSETQVEIVSCLDRISGIGPGVLLDALQRARFFAAKADPETALGVRAGLFAKDYPAKNRVALGSPCRLKEAGRQSKRALLLYRGEDRNSICKAMTDHGIATCIGHELSNHQTGQFFIPMRFWMPYGVWTEQDGSKVLFSRDYCPLWKIREGCAPVRDDPNRAVCFTEQKWFFDPPTFRQSADVARGLGILRENRIVSIPRLVEWLPECLRQRRWISYFKKWP